MSAFVRQFKPEFIHLFMNDQPLRPNVFAIGGGFSFLFFFIRIKDRGCFLNSVC